jgi:hypothetical protein
MVVFNVYEPPYAAGTADERAEDLLFVRDGFHWWAMLAPALWFLVKRLWLELGLFIAFVLAVSWGLSALGAAPVVAGIILIIAQIVIGFEAGYIQARALERKNWTFQGTVTGRKLDDCERRFLQDWLASQPSSPQPPRDGERAPRSPMAWAENVLDRARDRIDRQRRTVGAKA